MNTTTVILSVLNGQEYLRRCIDSVLNQSMGDFEFIIIDDGSTDDTPDIIKTHLVDKRVKVITHQRNRGISKSINDALEIATGKYVSFIEHDDWWVRDKLEVERGCFDDWGIGVVYSNSHIVQGSETKEMDVSNEKLENIRKGRNFINICALTIEKRYLDALKERDGNYIDESLVSSWDGDLLCRLLEVCRFRHNNKFVAYKQYHPGQISRRWIHHRDRVRVFSRYNRNPLSLMWNLYGIPLQRRAKNFIR